MSSLNESSADANEKVITGDHASGTSTVHLPGQTGTETANLQAPPPAEKLIRHGCINVLTGTTYDISRKVSIGSARNNTIIGNVSLRNLVKYYRSREAQDKNEVLHETAAELAKELDFVVRSYPKRKKLTGEWPSGIWDAKAEEAVDSILGDLQSGKLSSDKLAARIQRDAFSTTKVTLLDGAIFAGIFRLRQIKSLETPSDLMVIDLDKLSGSVEVMLAKFRADPLFFLVGLSPSRKGIKLVVRILRDAARNHNLWLACWETVKRYITQAYPGVTVNDVDKIAKSISQLCFDFYDPDCEARADSYVVVPAEDLLQPKANPRSAASRLKVAAAAAPAGLPLDIDWGTIPHCEWTNSRNVVRTLANTLHYLRWVDPDDRDPWFKATAALRLCFGEPARPFWDLWSDQSAKHKPSDEKTWKSCNRQEGEIVITIETIIDLARRNGCPMLEEDSVPELYYDRQRHIYWFAHGEQWTSVTCEAGCRLFREAGLSETRDFGVSEIDVELNRAIRERGLDIALPLAGWDAGIHDILGSRVLVTRGLRLPAAGYGECELIANILCGMLGKEQMHSFLAWLKLGYENLAARQQRPGQFLIFCGPKNANKSFVQHNIITPTLGGRSADASRYLMGRTEFNAELFGAEHLFLDDAKPYGNWLSKHDFAENIKAMVVAKAISCHAKGRQAVTLTPRWRLSMSLNDDPVSMRSMPDFIENFADKVMLLKCNPAPMPMPNGTQAERDALDQALRAEIPAFIAQLLAVDVPAKLHDDRFGVRAFHHPNLLEDAWQQSDEAKLHDLVCTVLGNPLLAEAGTLDMDRDIWSGTAADLQATLFTSRLVGQQARQLLSWANATGTLLGRLNDRLPKIYQTKRTRTARFWTIKLSKLRPEKPEKPPG